MAAWLKQQQDLNLHDATASTEQTLLSVPIDNAADVLPCPALLHNR
jgi:hypothetical protein